MSFGIPCRNKILLCRCDGPQNQNNFQEIVARYIDAKLSFHDAISLVFLNVDNKQRALDFCQIAEKSEENVMVQRSGEKLGIMFCLFAR